MKLTQIDYFYLESLKYYLIKYVKIRVTIFCLRERILGGLDDEEKFSSIDSVFVIVSFDVCLKLFILTRVNNSITRIQIVHGDIFYWCPIY